MPRGKDVDLNSPTKLCPACEKNLPWSEFHRCSSTVHGYQNRCKKCNYERHNAWRLQNLDKMAKDRKDRYKADPERYKDYTRKKNYGLLPGEYAQMLANQKGGCAICSVENPGGRGGFHVDHCHETGVIRGLLCHSCNVALGHFGHNPNLLRCALDYLGE